MKNNKIESEFIKIFDYKEKIDKLVKKRFILWLDFLGYRDYMKKNNIFKVALIMYYLKKYLEEDIKEFCSDSIICFISDTLIVLFNTDVELNYIIRTISNFQFFLYTAPNFHEYIYNKIISDSANTSKTDIKKLKSYISRCDIKRNFEFLNFVIRGYLTFGESGIFTKENKTLLFGDALARAATEEKNMIAPLIYIDNNLKNKIDNEDILWKTIDKRKKDVYGINYLMVLHEFNVIDENIIRIHKEFIEQNLYSGSGDEIRSKYNLLADMHNDFIDTIKLDNALKIDSR